MSVISGEEESGHKLNHYQIKRSGYLHSAFEAEEVWDVVTHHQQSKYFSVEIAEIARQSKLLCAKEFKFTPLYSPELFMAG